MDEYIWEIVIPIAAALVAFTVKNLIDCIIYAHPKSDETENERKKKKAKYSSICGIAGIVIVCIFTYFFTSRNSYGGDHDEVSSPAPTIETPIPSLAPEPSSTPISDEYVRDMRFDGANYTGYIDPVKRIPNGEGKMSYINGNTYDGEWVNGIQEGHGIMKYSNGDIYDGSWVDGKKDGSGTYTWSDGKTYTGPYKDDKRDGYGIYTGWTGYVSIYGWAGTYSGWQKDEMFDGEGVFEFDNGDKFDGVFRADVFWNGTYTRSDGSSYTISNGKPAK